MGFGVAAGSAHAPQYLPLALGARQRAYAMLLADSAAERARVYASRRSPVPRGDRLPFAPRTETTTNQPHRPHGGSGEGWGGRALAGAGVQPEWATRRSSPCATGWPRLVGGRSPGRPARLLAGFKGNPFAKAALDTAWWDLDASARGEPLWRAVGGVSPSVTVGADLGVMESVDRLLEAVEAVQAAGFRRLKLKFRPGWDVPVVEAVRRRFPDLPTHIDCNGAYTLADLPMFRALDGLGLAMIEQPLGHDDLVDHALLQAQLATPICLDESITSADRARQAAEIAPAGRERQTGPRRRLPGDRHPRPCAARNIPAGWAGCWNPPWVRGSAGLATCPTFSTRQTSFPRGAFTRRTSPSRIVLSGLAGDGPRPGRRLPPPRAAAGRPSTSDDPGRR